jgi:hypothetical protein
MSPTMASMQGRFRPAHIPKPHMLAGTLWRISRNGINMILKLMTDYKNTLIKRFKMIKKYTLILISLMIISGIMTACKNQKSDSNDNSVVNESTVISNEVQNDAKEVDDQETIKIKELATSFHNWYINAINTNTGTRTIKILEGENGKCRVDTTSYIKELRGIGTISEKFITEEKLRFKDCINFMENLDYSEYSNADAYVFDEHCGFFYYMYWIRSQEGADGVTAESVREDNDKWYVTLNFYNEYDGEISYWDVHKPIVELEKENNTYMITKITWSDK